MIFHNILLFLLKTICLKKLNNLFQCMMYKQVLDQQEKVEVTADFNSIRSSLGLSPSPFVTGGVHRQTTIEPIELEDKSPRLMEEDIPYLEELGFQPETIDQFYISDF